MYNRETQKSLDVVGGWGLREKCQSSQTHGDWTKGGDQRPPCDCARAGCGYLTLAHLSIHYNIQMQLDFAYIVTSILKS